MLQTSHVTRHTSHITRHTLLPCPHAPITASPQSPNLGPAASAGMINTASVPKPAACVPVAAALQPVALASMRSPENKPPRPPTSNASTAPSSAAAGAGGAAVDSAATAQPSSNKGRTTPPPTTLASSAPPPPAAPVSSSAPSVEPEREELQVNSSASLRCPLQSSNVTCMQLSEDESEFPATSPENSRLDPRSSLRMNSRTSSNCCVAQVIHAPHDSRQQRRAHPQAKN